MDYLTLQDIFDKIVLKNYIREFMVEALHEECDDEKANEKFIKYINMGYF